MPAKTPSQQRLMAMALQHKKGNMPDASKKIKDLSKSMSKDDLNDFASTKHSDMEESLKTVVKSLVKEMLSETKINEEYTPLEQELSQKVSELENENLKLKTKLAKVDGWLENTDKHHPELKLKEKFNSIINESHVAKMGYRVISSDSKDIIDFKLKDYPQHKALESAIQKADAVGGMVHVLNVDGSVGEHVWPNEINENYVGYIFCKEHSKLNEVVSKLKECGIDSKLDKRRNDSYVFKIKESHLKTACEKLCLMENNPMYRKIGELMKNKYIN